MPRWAFGFPFTIIHMGICHMYLLTCCFLLDKNPSLEIKYRPKKSREKETEGQREPERKFERQNSTPDYKSERRRGSKVRYFTSKCYVPIFLQCISKIVRLWNYSIGKHIFVSLVCLRLSALLVCVESASPAWGLRTVPHATSARIWRNLVVPTK